MSDNSDITRIKNLLISQFRKYGRRLAREIGEEIEQAYEDTYNEFMDVYINWAHTTKNGSDAEKSRFFLQASDAYWILGDHMIGEESKLPVTYSTLNQTFTANVNIDPSNIKDELYQRWGKNKGDTYDKKIVFDNMFYRGIMGYNWPMVQKSWYKTKESQKKYYRKYHIKGISHPSRMTILQEIRKANIIPPTAAKKPIKAMESRFKKITTKKHLDAKWDSIVGDLDKDIERLINNR